MKSSHHKIYNAFLIFLTCIKHGKAWVQGYPGEKDRENCMVYCITIVHKHTQNHTELRIFIESTAALTTNEARM